MGSSRRAATKAPLSWLPEGSRWGGVGLLLVLLPLLLLLARPPADSGQAPTPLAEPSAEHPDDRVSTAALPGGEGAGEEATVAASHLSSGPLAQGRRSGRGPVAWDVTLPALREVRTVDLGALPARTLQAVRRPIALPSGGVPAGFLTDHALSPPIAA